MTAFPYGFPTNYSRAYSGGVVWPRCINAEPGTYGHECSKPATCIGTDHETGRQACFCDDCAMNGSEGRKFADLQPIGPAPVAVGSWVLIRDEASAYAGRHCASIQRERRCRHLGRAHGQTPPCRLTHRCRAPRGAHPMRQA